MSPPFHSRQVAATAAVLTALLGPAVAHATPSCPIRATLTHAMVSGDARQIRITSSTSGDAGEQLLHWRTRSTRTRTVVMCQVREHVFIPPFDPDASLTSYFWSDLPTRRTSGHARIDPRDVPEGWDSFVSFTARYASKRR